MVSLGGIDFVDYNKKEAHVVPNLDSRKTYDHNADTVHIKITPDEARGYRQDHGNPPQYGRLSRQLPGEGADPHRRHAPQHHHAARRCTIPRTDKALIDTLKANLNPNIEVIEVEGNLDTPEWGVKAAKVMLEVMAAAKK